MTDSETRLLSLDALLADVSAEAPCGDDTREDASPLSPYFTLKDLRNQARALERQTLSDEEAPQIPQWRQLVEDIPPLLESRTKDLEFVAWLIEALCREHGFAGLSEGFELARAMIERYWENLYPSPDEEGLATRLAPLVGLNGADGDGTLIKPIISVPLFSGADGLSSFATWHAEQSAEVSRLDEDKAQSRIRSGAVAPDELMAAAQETPVEDLVATKAAITRASEAFTALSEVMDRVMDDPQPTTNIRKALERCQMMLNHHAGERIEQHLATQRDVAAAETEEDSGAEGDSATPARKSAGVDPVQVAIESRQEALVQLQRLSDFFRKTEPHSPVSYAITRAVRWSELSLPELMAELISDSGARDGFFQLTGVPAPESRE
ncbi:type VI secretion system protein TssA [Marinobacteraceae bacterium S3BR75-40.1]